MQHVKPVAKLANEFNLSLPWRRGCTIRSYNPRYRTRNLHITVARRQLDGWDDSRPQENYSEPWKDKKDTRAWEYRSTSETQHALTTQNRWDLSKPKRIAPGKEASLFLKGDSALVSGYESRIREEEWKIRGLNADLTYTTMRAAASEGKMVSIYKVQACVNHLLRDLGEQPNPRLYSALILAQCRADGSAFEAERLLAEMNAEGFPPEVGTCHDVLKVLSVHPDYTMRARILNYMRDRWFHLNESGYHDVVAGLVRGGHLEMALDYLDIMKEQRVRVKSWLYDLITYALAYRDELDECLRLIEERLEVGDANISPTLYHHLLDVAAHAHHYELTAYLWRARVMPGYIIPSLGTCNNAMNTASRRADVELCSEILIYLSSRDIVLQPQHYEMMIETYVRIGDCDNAFHVLSAMTAAGLVPDEGSTRPLNRHFMISHQRKPMDRLRVLRNLRADGKPVPIAAINILIEVCVIRDNLDDAMYVYRSIPELATASADLNTYNLLLKGCRGSKNVALQVASDMVKARVTPDALTYDRMILVCLIPPKTRDAQPTSEPASESLPETSPEPARHYTLAPLPPPPPQQQQEKEEEGPPPTYPPAAASPSPEQGQRESQPQAPPPSSPPAPVAEPPYEDALRYYSEMRRAHHTPRFGTLHQLIRALTAAGDARVWALLDEYAAMLGAGEMQAVVEPERLGDWVRRYFGKELGESLRGGGDGGRVSGGGKRSGDG